MTTSEITKSHPVTKRMVWAGYKQVKRNGGSAGIDRESIEQFDADMSKNLYKIWNRMTSGSYFPPPVRTVLIPKKQGGKRPLGIPTVGDRIAQTVVKQRLEPEVDAKFHSSSFGYRPHKKAHDAVSQCERHCRQMAWVIDVDIKGFFDNIDHDILMEMLRQHTQEKWVTMYIARWLKAGVEQEDGSIKQRCKGTPQGGVISPLLANIYLHHAFDSWMQAENPDNPFERYADDIVVHCQTQQGAEALLAGIEARMQQYKLELHPEKTKIVYCKDYRRNQKHDNRSFTFLGFSFEPRTLKSRVEEGRFLAFRAGISNQAKKTIRAAIKEVVQPKRYLHRIEWFAENLNAKIRGWYNYYGAFMREETLDVFTYINDKLVKWIKNVYKRRKKKAYRKLREIQANQPDLFYHWTLGIRS